MNWGKLLFVVMLLGMTSFAMVSCGKAERPASAVEQPAPTIEQSTPTPGGTMPLPPEGTRPAPPEGMTLGERPPAPAMDLVAAAAKLGVTEQQLRVALGELGQGPPDLATAATKLGVSEESLREVLWLPEGVSPAGGSPPAGSGPTSQGQ